MQVTILLTRRRKLQLILAQVIHGMVQQLEKKQTNTQ